jgi:uncharacterized peroxidase-related enzyme
VAFITTIPVDEASGDVRAMYENNQTPQGYVPNYAKVFSHRPHVMDAWTNLIRSIRSTMDTRRYELVTLAAARALRSSYCMLAHGQILRQRFFGLEELARIADDFSSASLTPAEVEMMRFAEKIARDASGIDQADVQALRDHGFTDAEVFDIAATAAARCFFSKMLDALGAEPDAAYREIEDDLRRQLLVGRPISEASVERLP